MNDQPTKHAQYTTATGNGAVDITVCLVQPGIGPRAWTHPHYLAELAVFTGAEVSLSTEPLPCWKVDVTDDTTDFEHSLAKLAYLDLAFVTQVDQCGAESTYHAVLTAAGLYSENVDPNGQSDGDTAAGTCIRCDPPHQVAPYLPPERPEIEALVGRIVTLTVTPNLANIAALVEQV